MNRVVRRVAAAGALAVFALSAPVTTVGPSHPLRTAAFDAGTSAIDAPFAFGMVGVSWDDELDAGPVQVRTLGASGWSPWTTIEPDSQEGPDAPRGTTVATRPLWVGRATRVQVRGQHGNARLHVIDPGDDPPRPPSRAMADPASPQIISRAQWGADESIRRRDPDYAPRIRMAFVHHTATGNAYGPDDSAAIVRSIYAYHVNTNGWDDIGYNALVDRYGRVFEGRWGALDRPVVGAHAQGFNNGSAGVAIIGTLTDDAPPAAAIDALQRFLAWRLDVDRVNPAASTTVKSGGSPKYPVDSTVTLPTLLGHRDTGETDCPGGRLYALLPSIRNAVNTIGAPKLYEPVLWAATITPNGDGNADVGRVTASFDAQMEWRFEISDGSGTVVRRMSGFARRMDVTWDARDDSDVLQTAGRYTARISASDGASSIRPWTATIEVGA